MKAKDKRIGDKTILLVLFLLSLLQGVSLSGFNTVIGYDASHYFEIAENAASGRGYITNFISFPSFGGALPHEDLYRPPLFVYSLALVFMFAGASFAAAQLIPILFAALLIPVTYLLGRELFGRSVGLISALAVLLSSEVLFLSIQVITETQFTFLFTASLYFLVKWYRTRDCRQALAFGILLGLSFLSRPQALLAAPLLVPPVFYAGGRLGLNRKMLSQALLALALFLVVAGPWMARTYYLTGSPLYSETGILLKYAGSLQSENEMFAINLDMPTLQENMASHPVQFMLSWARNVMHLSYETMPLLTPVVFLFSVFGLLLSFKDYRRHAAAYYIILAYLAFFGLVFVIGRYMFPLVPLFIIYSIFGMQQFAGTFKKHGKGIFILVLIAALGLSWSTGINKTIELHGAERLEWKEAGEWIRSTGNTQPIMSDDPSIAHYAESAWVVLPYNALNDTLEFAKSYNVSYIVFDTGWVSERPQLSILAGGQSIQGLEMVHAIEGSRTVFTYKIAY
jgi:4-amino-4-deoxy-L-arabinose transferase-like glycosyltransferase